MAVSEVELYKFAPWDLPEKSCFRTKDLEWYFFCPRDKKYPKGSRANRSTEIGYWKTTGKDRSILNGSHVVGMKKSLIFHTGKPPKGDRTDWVMYEYRLTDDRLAASGVAQDAFVICKIFKKSGLGPKIGEQYGAPFNEEDWEDDSELEAAVAAFPFLPCLQSSDGNDGCIQSSTSIPELIPRSEAATTITEPAVAPLAATTVAEPVEASVPDILLQESGPLSLAAESAAIQSAATNAGGFFELPAVTGPPFGTPQYFASISNSPEWDGIPLDELTELLLDPPYDLGIVSDEPAPQPPAPAVGNFNEVAVDETNVIYGELADLIDGVGNDGDELAQLNGTVSNNNNWADSSLSEPGAQHYVELNDIFFDQPEAFFSYNPIPSPEMDIDIFFSGDAPP